MQVCESADAKIKGTVPPVATSVAIIYESSKGGNRPVRREATDRFLRDRPSLSTLNKLRNRFRRRLTPGEVQRLEQRSRTRL